MQQYLLAAVYSLLAMGQDLLAELEEKEKIREVWTRLEEVRKAVEVSLTGALFPVFTI